MGAIWRQSSWFLLPLRGGGSWSLTLRLMLVRQKREGACLSVSLLQGWLCRCVQRATDLTRSPGETWALSLQHVSSPNTAGRIPVRGLGLVTLKGWFIFIFAAFSTSAEQCSFTHKFGVVSCVVISTTGMSALSMQHVEHLFTFKFVIQKVAFLFRVTLLYPSN